MPERVERHHYILNELRAGGERALRVARMVDVAVYVFDGERYGSALSARSLADARLKDPRRRHRLVRGSAFGDTETCMCTARGMLEAPRLAFAFFAFWLRYRIAAILQ